MAKTLKDLAHLVPGMRKTRMEQIEEEEKQYRDFIAKVNASKGQVEYPIINRRGKTDDVR